MNDHTTTAPGITHAERIDNPAASEIGDDYESFERSLAGEREPQAIRHHCDGIAFSSDDYATTEEAHSALEAFLMREFEVSDEDE